MKKYSNPTILFAIVAIGIGFFYWSRYHLVPTIAFADTLVTSQTGQQVKLGEEINGPTVIHFYATWCGPCMRELRDMTTAIQSTELSNLNYIFVTDDSIEKIENIKKTLPTQIRIFQTASLQALNIYTIPTTYFINSKNEIVKQQVNPCEWSNQNFQQEIITLTK